MHTWRETVINFDLFSNVEVPDLLGVVKDTLSVSNEMICWVHSKPKTYILFFTVDIAPKKYHIFPTPLMWEFASPITIYHALS